MSKHKLLLADDSITIQKVVNLTFADEGVEVFSVGDGNAAMEKFAEITPDLVMADINMPGLNGYEICERIKNAEATRRIPVILLVGSFEPFDEEEARRVGADDFLTKPFQSIRQLVTKVSGLLESSAANADAATDEIISDLETSGAQAVPGEFEDTLRMRKQESTEEEFGDTGMDDEMIQTNQVGGYGYDETPKFQSPTESESEDTAKTQPLTTAELDEIGYQTPEQIASEGETSAEEESAYVLSDETPSAENLAASEEAYVSPEQAETPQTFASSESEDYYKPQEEEVSPAAETGAALEIEDDANLLELPPQENLSSAAALSQSVWQEDVAPIAETFESEPDSEFRQQTEAETAELSQSAANIAMPRAVEEVQSESSDETPTAETPVEEAESSEAVADETSGEAQAGEIDVREVPTDEMIDTSQVEPAESEREETGAESETAQIQTLPPEVIEAIAAKVSERFSDRIIREIVAEVTPQITELIARRIAEDNSKE